MSQARSVFLLALIFVPAIAAPKPITNMIDVPVPVKVDSSSYTAEEVRAAIIEGCLASEWVAVVDDEGQVRATLNIKNKHFAEVEIPYSASSYSIIYTSSTNLNYNEARQTIHRNYNRWVLRLSQSIDKVLRNPPPPTTNTPESGEGDIYSEILKLDDLRNRGLLTDEEFETEKRKLLTEN